MSVAQNKKRCYASIGLHLHIFIFILFYVVSKTIIALSQNASPALLYDTIRNSLCIIYIISLTHDEVANQNNNSALFQIENIFFFLNIFHHSFYQYHQFLKLAWMAKLTWEVKVAALISNAASYWLSHISSMTCLSAYVADKLLTTYVSFPFQLQSVWRSTKTDMLCFSNSTREAFCSTVRDELFYMCRLFFFLFFFTTDVYKHQ